MDTNERAALERLLKIAQGVTGQSGKVADFLLSWWNADECGGFDLRSTWSCDDVIVGDIVTVFRFVAENAVYPDSESLGLGKQFEALVKQWRPDVLRTRDEHEVKAMQPKLRTPRNTSAN